MHHIQNDKKPHGYRQEHPVLPDIHNAGPVFSLKSGDHRLYLRISQLRTWVGSHTNLDCHMSSCIQSVHEITRAISDNGKQQY